MLKTISEMTSETSLLESDMTGNVVSNVLLMSTRFSKNGYEYSSKAQEQLTNMAENSHAYIDHHSLAEDGKRDHVRSVRDFLGTFVGAQKTGDKIRATLQVREAHMPLVRDLVRLKPKGIGFSLAASVFMGQQNGKEVVEGVKKLKSWDLVSQAAANDGILEAHIRKHKGILITEKDVAEFLEKLGIKTVAQASEQDINEFIEKVESRKF